MSQRTEFIPEYQTTVESLGYGYGGVITTGEDFRSKCNPDDVDYFGLGHQCLTWDILQHINVGNIVYVYQQNTEVSESDYSHGLYIVREVSVTPKHPNRVVEFEADSIDGSRFIKQQDGDLYINSQEDSNNSSTNKKLSRVFWGIIPDEVLIDWLNIESEYLASVI